MSDIMSHFEDEEFKNNVINNISDVTGKFGKTVCAEMIWIDSPKNPSFKEATNCIIKSSGSPKDYIILRDVFPTDDWVRAFAENKWQGFVFTMPGYCEIVAAASKIVFEEIFDTTFNEFSTLLCKIDNLPELDHMNN